MILINNEFHKTKSRNQYEMGHKHCKPGSIMFVFDGDDVILGKQNFKLINAIYQKTQSRFVYFNFVRFQKKMP
jgi:hypothetical protein